MRKELSRLLVLVMVFSIFQSVGFSPKAHASQTITVPVTADKFVDKTGAYPTGIPTNLLIVGYERDQTEDYGAANAALKFDLGDIPGTVQSATLNIYIKTETHLGDTPFIDLWGSSQDDWLETTPALPTTDVEISKGVVGFEQDKWKAFDVTSFVSSQAKGDKIASFVLKGIQVDKPAFGPVYNPQIVFFDRINTTYRSYLEITYDPNTAPTDLTLSATSITENSPAGTNIGTLTATDANAGDTFTYTITGGDTDSFTIQGNTLKTAKSFDYETKNAYSVKVRVTDSGGLTFEKTFAIQVTNVAPSVSLQINGNADVTNSANVSLSLTADPPENVGLQMRFSNDSSNPTAWSAWETFATSKAWTLQSGDGDKTVYLEVKDSAGTVSRSKSIKLDTTAPTGSLLINNGASHTNSTAVTLNLNTGDAEKMRFSNDGAGWSNWETAANTKNWTLIGGDGTKTVYMEIRDRTGNVTPLTDTILLDTDPPTGAVSINGGASHTKERAVTLGITADGAVEMRFSNTNSDWSDGDWESVKETKGWTLAAGDGEKTVYVQVRDVAGNVTTASDTIFLDTTAPVVTGVADNRLYNADLTISFDEGTAMLDGNPFLNNGKVSEEGPHTLIVTDAVGNVTTIHFTLDTIAPSATLAINGGKAHTNSATVNLAITAGDATEMRISNDETWDESWEAVASAKTWTLAGGDGPKKVYLQVRDEAGNISEATNAEIKLDTVAPIVTGVNEDGLYNTDVKIEFDDGEAKLNGTNFSNGQTVSEDGSYTLVVADQAENVTTRHFTIDKTKPIGTILINGGKDFTNNPSVKVMVTKTSDTQTMQISNNQTDWTSFPVLDGDVTWQLDDTVDGEKIVYLKLTDKAGNEGVVHETIELDTIPPTGTVSINNGAAYATDQEVTLSLTYNGATQMRFSNNGTYLDDWEAISPTKTWRLSDGDEAKTVYVQFRDQAENNVSASDAITLDTTAPIVSGVDDNGVYNANVTITFNEGTATLNGDPFAKNQTVSEEKSHTLIVTDDAGNVTTVHFILDKTAPAGSLSINSGAAYTNTKDVTLTIEKKDAVQMRFSHDGVSWGDWETATENRNWMVTDGDGEKTVYMQLKDAANNTSNDHKSITLDTIVPTAAIQVNHRAAFTNEKNVTLSVSASDSSGADLEMRVSQEGAAWHEWEAYAASKSFTLAGGDGDKTIKLEVRDAAGNIASAQTVIKLDTTAPDVEDIADGAYYNADQTIDFDEGHAELDGNPISSGDTVSAEGPHTLVVTDDAGNTTTIRFTLDKTAPTGTIQINDGNAQTSSRQVKLTLDTDDNIGPVEMRFSNDNSGWSNWENADVTKNWTLTSGDGEKTVYAELRDKANNVIAINDTIRLNTYIPPVNYPVTGVTLNQTSLKMKVGDSPVSLDAEIQPANATNQTVRWHSSNPDIATVDGNGTITAKRAGTTTITVTTVDGNKTASCLVTVEKEEIRLEASESSIRVEPKKTTDFRVYAITGDERKDITKNKKTDYSQDNKLITVTPGKIRAGKKTGKTIITVRYEGQELEIPVTISDAKLESLVPSVDTAVLEPEDELQLTLKAIYDDESEEEVADEAKWSSSDADVVTVSKVGKLTAKKSGTAVVTVKFDDKEAEIKVLVVKAKKPKKLTADKSSIRIKSKETYVPIIRAIYEKGFEEVVPAEDITWTSRNTKIATVEDGEITGGETGRVTIVANYKGKRVNMTVTVRK